MPTFTPTESRILHALSDGMPHRSADVLAFFEDELATKKTLQSHLSNIRKKLAPKGEDIVCEYWKGGFSYRHVRILKTS